MLPQPTEINNHMNYIVSMLSPKETLVREDSTSTLKIETLIHTDEKQINTQISYEHGNNKYNKKEGYSSEFIALFKFNFGQNLTPEDRSIDSSKEGNLTNEDDFVNRPPEPSSLEKQKAKEMSLLDLSSSKDSLIKEFDDYNDADNIFDLSKSMIYNEISIK